MNKKVSELIEANELTDEDILMILQSGQNKKIKAKNAFSNKADQVDLDDLSSTVNDLTSEITELKKPKRVELFNNSGNQSKTINLADSAYNYSYIYLQNAANYNVIIPIYSDNQTNLRGIGGWSGAENVGTNHFYGTLSNEGKVINVTYFRAMVHTANGNHNEGDDYDVTLVVGIR